MANIIASSTSIVRQVLADGDDPAVSVDLSVADALPVLLELASGSQTLILALPTVVTTPFPTLVVESFDPDVDVIDTDALRTPLGVGPTTDLFTGSDPLLRLMQVFFDGAPTTILQALDADGWYVSIIELRGVACADLVANIGTSLNLTNGGDQAFIFASGLDSSGGEIVGLTFIGTDGPDTLTGTAAPDLILGLEDGDALRGEIGADTLLG